MSKYQDILEIGSTPINQDNPVGDPVSYDPAFELMESEIGKLQSLAQGEVDWGQIIKAGEEILRDKSKDLNVASWFCFALFKQSEFEGLAAGFKIYYDLITNFWEPIYPELKRMRRRVNIAEWLFENIGKTLSQMEIRVGDDFKSCNDHSIKIIDFLDEKFGEQSPLAAFNEVKRNFSDKISQLEQQAPAVADSKPGETALTATSKPHLMGEGEINDAESANKAIKEALKILKKSAILLQNEEGVNPLYHRLTRISVWSMVSDLPPHNDFITPIPEIQPELLKTFKDLQESADWQLLFKRAEAQFINTPLWLDLQRYSSISSGNLGGEYQRVDNVIGAETLSLVNRFPDILELKFAGGTPFADDETKIWFEGLQKTSGEDPESESTADDTQAKLDATTKEVRKLLAKNKLREAVETWNRNYTHDGSEKSSFTAKLLLAKLFLGAKKLNEAAIQLEILDDEVKYFNLEKWDPVLSAEVVKLLVQSIHSGPEAKRPEQKIRLDCLKKRLYKLDIASALTVV